jgi:ATP-dependent 26S proteasome regulatory subunit
VSKLQGEESNINKTTPDAISQTTQESETQQRCDAISSTIQLSKQSHNFSNVAGLDHVKQTLRESLLLPAQFPGLFQGCRAPWRSLLLYGPPGLLKCGVINGYLQDACPLEENLAQMSFCLSTSHMFYI